jgi:hypothetical protein
MALRLARARFGRCPLCLKWGISAADVGGMLKQIAVLKIRMFAAAAICSLAALLYLAPMASATGSQLDQSYTPTVNSTDTVSTSESVAETFTVGIAGVLTDVEVPVSDSGSPNAPIVVDITTLTAGAPNLSNVVGTGTIPASSLNGSAQYVTTTLSLQPTVTVGEQLALVLTTTNTSGSYSWWDANVTGYAGGSAFERTGGSWNALSGWDKAFATFVGQPAPTSGGGPRGAYCTIAGDTTDSGAPLAPGMFVNLDDGQVNGDPHYAGATPANFVNGVGLTCAPPPAGYTRQGYATADMNVDAGMYPYYSN